MPILTLNPIKDSYIHHNDSTNYGLSTTLKLGKETNWNGYNIAIKFDLASIPQKTILNSAKIKFYISSVTGAETINEIQFGCFKNEWQENTIADGNIPSYYNGNVGELIASARFTNQVLNTSKTGTWIEYDIIGIIKSLAEGKITNNGVYIYIYTVSNTSDVILNIPSREYSDATKRPQLVIDYSLAPPSQPSNLSPTGQIINRATINRLSWQHNPVTPGSQTKFDLQWRKQGGTTWNTVSQTTANQYWDAPANTFPLGMIEWQVRTTDTNNMVSPYSAISIFKASEKPASPVITSPTATVTEARLTAQWTSAIQTEYDIELMDINNNVLREETKISTDKVKTFDYLLNNNTTYKVKLRVKNSDGLWSDYTTITFTVVYAEPPKPMITIESDNMRGSIKVNIQDPVGTPEIVYNEINRRKQGETMWMRIATNIPINTTFIDFTPQHNAMYEYKARAISDLETFAESNVSLASVTVSNSQIALVSDFSKWVELKASPQKKLSIQYDREMKHFAGRKYPLSVFTEKEENTLALAFKIMDDATLDKLMEIIEARQTMLYRDSSRHRMFGTVAGIVIDDQLPDYCLASFNIDRVDYMEEV